MAKKNKGRIVNPPKRKPEKIYGGSTTAPVSIRLQKQIAQGKP